MKKLFYTIILFFVCQQTIAQTYTLEQIDFSPAGNVANFHTFPMGINNNGYVCGYYVNTLVTDTVGFVITPIGNIITITNAITGAGSYGIKAVGINDDNMVLINYTDAGGISKLHKCLVNKFIVVNDWPITNNVNQNNVKAFHYNNKGDITGWYQGVGNRWMFTLHDGGPPAGFNAWQAWRYNIYVNPNYTYYNTMAGAMDTNRVVTGFYIDGSQNIPFLYEELYAAFYVLNGSTWCHPWGKNNNGKIVGEYKNGGGYLNAFVATPTYTPGNPNSGQLNMTSLANIFHVNTIQSIARAINDSNEIVGSYIDPANGNWVGYIYRPNSGEYKIKNYTYNKHVWTQLANNTGAPSSGNVWTTNHYGAFNYGTVDPFANNNYALIENHIATDPAVMALFNPGANIANLNKNLCVDWNSFMKEIVNSGTYYANSQSPAGLGTYRFFDKRNMVLKWLGSPNSYAGPFGGICYGFAGTSMMHHLDDTYLDTKFGIGANTALNSYTDNNPEAITAVERVYLRQFDPSLSAYTVDKKGDLKPWQGIYRCKFSWMKEDSLDYRQIYIGWRSPTSMPNYGYHSVLPYKIITPQKLPFYYNGTMNYDTMYIYDSNYPTSQTEYILIKSDKIINDIDSTYSPQYSPSPNQDFFVSFNEVSVKELMAISNSALKKSRALDSIARLELSRNCDYTIKDAATQNVTFKDITGFNNGISTLSALAAKANKPVHITSFYRDTIAELQISSTNYRDSMMNFTFDNDKIRMSLLRRAIPTETDNATCKNRYMSYGNPDNVTKQLVADFSQSEPNSPTACIITVSNLMITPQDSIITLNPANYQYQIIHPTNDTLSYTVNIIALYNDTVKQFTAGNILIDGNTSHTIDPYFAGPQGPQTAILIDNGQNANNDDTLFVQQVALGTSSNFKNADFVKLYPNPVQHKINIDIQNDVRNEYIVLMSDMNGAVVNRSTLKHTNKASHHTIDIEKLNTGIYLVWIFDNKNQAIFKQKVIKQ